MSTPRRARQISERAKSAAPWRNWRAIGMAMVALIALTIAAAIPGVRWLGGWVPGARTAPNILLITLDTTRADHLSAYGYRLGRTTHLDRLAAEGVLFER